MNTVTFAKSAVVAAIAALSIGASAQSAYKPIGDVNDHFSLTQIESKWTLNGGAFTDIWSFTVTEPLYSSGVLTNLQIELPNGSYWYNITGLSVSLYSGVSTLDPTYQPGDTSTLLDTLTAVNGTFKGQGYYVPGEYFFQISGTATGIAGGQYVFTATTAPVPEPETYAMLMAGLGVMGAIAVRRKKAKND